MVGWILAVVVASYGLMFWAIWRVQVVIRRWTEVAVVRGVRGADVAARILEMADADGYTIVGDRPWLGDDYVPRKHIVRLSEQSYHGTSVAAVSTAAHEAGHALQDMHGYWPLRLAYTLAPWAILGSQAGVLFALAGLVTGSMWALSVGCLMLALSALYTLICLPMEFDASRRALRALQETGYLRPEELEGARQVLRSAAWTYASASVSAASRLAIVVGQILTRRR